MPESTLPVKCEGKCHGYRLKAMIVRYQVILAYDGTHFSGFQRQARGRTVQGVFEDALRNLGWEGKSILAAGRTDAGVHSTGQVISFDLEWKHSINELQSALNGHLPHDIAVMQVIPNKTTFHPRFDALSRRYRYSLYSQPVRDPLRERYSWRVWPPADFEIMQEAANCFTGTHDFAAFGTPPRAGSSTIRTVFRADWEKEQDNYFFNVVANAFLFHMVRRMVFFQVAVGQARVGMMDLCKSLTEGKLVAQNGSYLPQGIAPPNGLVLMEVTYPMETEDEDAS